MYIYICIVSIIIIILNIHLLFNQLAIPLPLTPQMGGWAPKSRGVPPSAFPPKEGAPFGPLEIMHNAALTPRIPPRICGGPCLRFLHIGASLSSSIINVRLYLLYTDVSCDKIYLYIHSYLSIFHLFNFINRLIQNRVISTNK